MRYTVTIEETIVEQLDVLAPNAEAAERMVVRMIESDLGIKHSPDYQQMPGSMEITVKARKEHGDD